MVRNLTLAKPFPRIYRPAKSHSYEAYQYLVDSRYCGHRSELARMYLFLESKLLNIFNFIEPTTQNFKTHSIQNYELLIQACMEIENNFKEILTANRYPGDTQNWTMKDYSKLNEILKLNEYSWQLNISNEKHVFCPFQAWSNNSENCSRLDWYHSYNQVKHNRTTRFSEASLENDLFALTGLLTLLYAQFGPYSTTINHTGSLASLTDDGLYIEHSQVLFNLKNKPKFNTEEFYDFDWNLLQKEECPFSPLEILTDAAAPIHGEHN